MAQRMTTSDKKLNAYGKDVVKDMKELYLQLFGSCYNSEEEDFFHKGDEVLKIALRLNPDEKIDIRVKVEVEKNGQTRVVKDVLLSNLVENGINVPDNIDMISLSGRIQFTMEGKLYEAKEGLFSMKVFVADEKYMTPRHKKMADAENFYVVDYKDLQDSGFIRNYENTAGI